MLVACVKSNCYKEAAILVAAASLWRQNLRDVPCGPPRASAKTKMLVTIGMIAM